MGRFQCPSCATVVEGDDPSTLVCPSCGYGSRGGAARPQPSQPYPPQQPQQPQKPAYGTGTSPTYQPSTAPGGAPYGTTPYGSPPQYGSAGQPGYAIQKKSAGMAVAALILGIAGLCLALLFPPLGIVPGILGLIFGILGIKQVNQDPHGVGGKGMAVAGLVMGSIAIVWGIIGILLISIFGLEELERWIQEAVALVGKG